MFADLSFVWAGVFWPKADRPLCAIKPAKQTLLRKWLAASFDD
jgi:hypothetical protein